MKTNKLCIWENYPIEIEKDFDVPNKDGYTYDNYACSHIKNGKLKIVVIGTNEGGCDSVGMCGECLFELLNKELTPTH